MLFTVTVLPADTVLGRCRRRKGVQRSTCVQSATIDIHFIGGFNSGSMNTQYSALTQLQIGSRGLPNLPGASDKILVLNKSINALSGALKLEITSYICTIICKTRCT